MFNSLRQRLVLSHVLVVVLSLLLGFLTLVVAVRPVLIRVAYTTLLDKAIPTARLVGERMQAGGEVADLKALLVQQSEEQQVRILLVEMAGRVVLDTGGEMEGERLSDLPPTPRDPNSRGLRGAFRTPSGREYLYVAVPAAVLRPAVEAQRPFLLVLATPARNAWGFLRQLLSGFAWAGIVALLVAAGLALLITRSLSTPIKQIAGAARAIAQGNYDQRLEIRYPSEMEEVAASFNQMTADVKRSRQTMRDLVANVSHELKTPLTSIRGFAEAILDGATHDAAGQQRAAEIIREEAMRMSRLVEQLLDLSKIESGQVVMARNPVQVDQVLQACVDKMSLAAREKSVRLACDCPPLPPLPGDGDRLAQVFVNLLDNALAHTPAQGKVSATGRLVREAMGDHQRDFIEVAVTDTGSGIPADELDRVFERFYQLDKARSGASRGAGLGLAISKSIVEAHGGRIWAESVQGLGSRFVVRLPV